MSPWLVGRVLLPVHESLKGKPTFPCLRSLERSQWLAPEALARLQSEHLQGFVTRAYARIPYYRRVMDERGLRPEDIRTATDLRGLPFLDRDDLRRHWKDLQPDSLPRGTQRISTGGSTGAPASVLVTMEQFGFGEAARLRAHRWFGLQPGAREIVLWGSPIELGRQSRWREVRDRLLNSRLLSAFDLSPPALSRYAQAILRDRPQKLYGYASALALLAEHLQRTGHRPQPGWPRAVFTTAEPLFDFQRRAIRDGFGCPAATEYGARDAGLIAHECPAGRLHVNAEGIIVEIAPAEGLLEPGSGEIVVTNLWSHAMPLIRYRTGDIGRLGVGACPCGRSLPVLDRVEGRSTDFLVTADGRVMHALAVIYVLREMPSVRQFQVVQEHVNELRVSLVPEAELTPPTRTELVARLQALFGPRTHIQIDVVPAIARPPSGKHRHVVSRVAEARLRPAEVGA